MKPINDSSGLLEVEPHVIPCPPAGMTSPRLRPSRRFARMQRFKTIVPVCFALLLAACGGGGHLSVQFPAGGETELPEGEGTLTLEFPPGSAQRHRLPRISGGIPPYESSIDGCPDWVTLFPDQAILAGTAPAQDRGRIFFCTYRVTESDPGFRPARSVSYGLRLRVGSIERLRLPQPDKIDLSVGEFHGDSEPLPTASGGVDPYTYSFTCAGGSLPSGMGFAPATRVFAGTPDAPFRDSCTYTVTDSSQPAETVSRAVEVEVTSTTLEFRDDVPAEVSLRVGTFYNSESDPFPEAEGGVEPYMYSFTCAGGPLPSGMGFAPETRVFAGSPNTPFRDSCTYTVTDSSQPAETVSRAVEVKVKSTLTLPEIVVPDEESNRVSLNVQQQARIEPFLPATGGVEPYTYSFTCAGGSLPSGMGFAPATRVFAGTPDAPFYDSCTYMVTDSSQPAETASRAVEVEVTSTTLTLPEIVVPDEESNRVSLNVQQQARIEPFLPATGGVEPYTYTFTCAGSMLPSGMGFAPETRIFAGTPEARFYDSCTYTVTDSSQPAETVSRAVEVEVTSTTLEFRDDVPGEVNLRVGTFLDLEFPKASGGIEPYTYSFTCAGGSLPSGMGFAPETRRFAGTPNAPFRDSCTYTVTDSAQPAETVSQAVEVEVTGQTLTLPEFVVPGNLLRLGVDQRVRITFRSALGGVPPYTYELDCPDSPPGSPDEPPDAFPPPSMLPPGLGFGPETRVLSGTPEEAYGGPDCTYRVTDSADVSFSRNVALIIEPEREKWRFTERTLAPTDVRLDRDDEVMDQTLRTLPVATVEAQDQQPGDTTPIYRLDVRLPLRFNPGADTRTLVYEHPRSDRDPPLCRISTYRYQVLFGDSVEDTLCIDVSYRDGDENTPCDATDRDEDDDTEYPLIATVRIRDDAYFGGAEHHCPPSPLQPSSASRAPVSNPVHTALAPVHARRALDVAHGAVADRVRSWSRGEWAGDAHMVSTIAPAVGIGSLSGWSGGFDYAGSSESLSTGVELGAGSWQAGLIGSFTRTELHYRAEASLAEHGYVAGDHDTEILSLHPFAAWHAPSGGHLWASLGAGTGDLHHRDDHGFPTWSRSDVHLRSWAAGGSVPVADILAGELQAEAGIESFSFDIDGGGRISSSLPTLRGRDWHTGLAWSAPVPGAPSVSVAYRRLTGDGPEGGRLEARGAVSVDGVFDPRLALLANAEASFGLGDLEHDSWGLSGGVRFAPGAGRRGFGLQLDTRLQSVEDGDSTGVGIRAEAGYGLWGGPLFGALRPHVGLTRHPDGGFLRRSVGVDLRDTPHSRAKVEIHDHPHDPSPALRFSLRQRF